MAVFTAIASAIVTAIGVSTATIIGTVTWASLATSVIATGLAIGTAKLLGVFEPPKATMGKDPGVKIQLAPSTDNKIPRFYGRNYAGGMIIDAEIKNQNKTMAYAIVISEYNDANDNWSINDIYRGDAKLNFSGATVQSVTDPNATASNKVQGKMRCRVYAGGSTAAHQIFPTTDLKNAYGGPANGGTGQFTNWTSANAMTDLVFAIFEMDYEPEEGLTGLGAITFDINNALTNPADVMLDYLKSDRYGAQLTDGDLDLASFTAWRDHCDVNVNYITQANVTSQHTRLQIDGAISTFNSVKQNINDICLSGGAFFTYNNKTGKFGVVVNRAATVGELANAFVINNDNIVSSLTFRSTDLLSLYNRIEVEYPSVNHRDQTDIYIADVDASLKNPNEPENTLKYRMPHVNDRTRVATLANIDINQSRLNTVIELTTDHSGIQMDVGDVIKLTEPLYGYTEKLFRVMRTTEIEDSEGTLTVKVVLLEYDSDVYGDLLTQEDLDPLDTRITNWWVENSNTTLSIGNVTIVNDPRAATANVHNPATGAVIGTANMANVRSEFGSMYAGEGVFINVPIDIPANTTFNTAKVVCINETASNAQPAVFVQSPATAYTGNASYLQPGDTYNFGIDGFTFSKDTEFRMEISLEDTVSGSASRRYVTGSFQVSKSNIINPPDMSPGAAGVSFTRELPHVQLPDANVTQSPVSTYGWDNYDIHTDVYNLAVPVGSVDDFLDTFMDDIGNANITQTYGSNPQTQPEFIGAYSILGSTFFTGVTTTPDDISIRYQSIVAVVYPGNVAQTMGLTANVDYVVNPEDAPPNNLPGASTPRLIIEPASNTEIEYSYLAYGIGFSNEETAGSTQLTISYPFKVFPTALILISMGVGASNIQEENEFDERGFATFYTITSFNKGLFETAYEKLGP
jgi:hypothetical protein